MAHIPPELRRRPFTLAEARQAGISRKHLRSKAWRRIGSELYCWAGWREDSWGLLAAWKSRVPSDAVFAGTTAAWLWGVGLNLASPIEIVVPLASGARSRPGLTVRRATLSNHDIAQARGYRVTSLERTLRDICARTSEVESLIAIDMAVKEGMAKSRLIEYAEAARGRPGARRLLELAALAAPAESPMETRLRWLLLRQGLPQPCVQIDLRDGVGRFLGRADLFYPGAQLAIEYDGMNHRDRLIDDDRRQNLLVDAGFKLLRFTAADLDRPLLIASLVQNALRHRAV